MTDREDGPLMPEKIDHGWDSSWWTVL